MQGAGIPLDTGDFCFYMKQAPFKGLRQAVILPPKRHSNSIMKYLRGEAAENNLSGLRSKILSTAILQNDIPVHLAPLGGN